MTALTDSRRRRSSPLVNVFAGIIALQLLLAVLSIDLLSAVRSYVSGESLYAKGQKDSHLYLLDYAQSRREEDYQKFLRALAIPLADRAAREALQKPQPDLIAARRAFEAGGNHPDDIGGLMRLFRWFHKLPLLAEPIATWTAGDGVIEKMRSLAELAHDRVAAGELDAPAVLEMRIQVPVLNEQLTVLEQKFSAQLGESSRLTERLLLGLNVVLAALLALTGLRYVRHTWRVQALADDEVKRRQDSLQRLLDSAAEGLYGVDLEGRCTFINRAALEMLGYERETDLVGRPLHALIHHSRADGSTYPLAESKISEAYRERRGVHVGDEVFWRRDGSSFPVEYWSHPVVQDGKVDGAVATFFDISARLQMQATLRERELRMDRLVDAVTDGIITIDVDERIVLFNRAAEQLFGVCAADAIGSPIQRFIPRLSSARDASVAEFAGGDDGGRIVGGLRELTGSHADATEFPIEASLSRLETEQGVLTTVVLRDVTEVVAAREERQAREALEASSRAKTEFLSRMSHELRTPLNAVLGFSQLLRLDAAPSPTLRQLDRIRHIENAGTHLLALVNDVLDLSRFETPQMAPELEPVDLGSAVDEALGMVSSLAAQNRVELVKMQAGAEGGAASSAPHEGQQSAPRASDPWVLADRVRLVQILVNLLSNAVKYNRFAGSVTVEWRLLDGACHVRITDTGQGLPPEKLARMFEPFNRLGAEKSRVQGSGIGLVLSRRLVEQMRGDLRIESVVGQGTVATLILPGSDRPAASPPLHALPSQHGALDGELNVLYAEDDPVNAELVRQILTLRPGISLRLAESGTSALDMARRDPPDLMLVDMNLGDMTGQELAAELHRHSSTRDIQLVALSADALPEQIAAALAGGFECYLTKPIEFRKLLDVLDWRCGLAA